MISFALALVTFMPSRTVGAAVVVKSTFQTRVRTSQAGMAFGLADPQRLGPRRTSDSVLSLDRRKRKLVFQQFDLRSRVGLLQGDILLLISLP
jgi:hypothetical protein